MFHPSHPHIFLITYTPEGVNELLINMLIMLPAPFILGSHPQHMEVPRLGVESELQLLAYTTATATWDPSYIFDLHTTAHSNAGSFNPPSGTRDQTRVLMDTS